MFLPPTESIDEAAQGPLVRIAGYYHNSLIEGPGRRSCVLLSGCDLKCKGCWVPRLHPSDAGQLVSARRIATLLVDPSYARDGVSILGGEPFFQPEGLLALVRELRALGCPHILCYSGHSYESLLRRSVGEPAIAPVLAEIDILIDGPYVEALAFSAGPWTGSGNQRVIDLAATRRTGHVVRTADRMVDSAKSASRAVIHISTTSTEREKKERIKERIEKELTTTAVSPRL